MREIAKKKEEKEDAQGSIARIEIPHGGDLKCPYCGGARKDTFGHDSDCSYKWNCAVCGRHFVYKPRVIITYALPDYAKVACPWCGHTKWVVQTNTDEWLAEPEEREQVWCCKSCNIDYRVATKFFVEFRPDNRPRIEIHKEGYGGKVVRSNIVRKEVRDLRDLKCPHCKGQEHAFIPEASYREASLYLCLKCKNYFITLIRQVITREELDDDHDVYCPYCGYDATCALEKTAPSDSSEPEQVCYNCGGIFQAVFKHFVEFEREDE